MNIEINNRSRTPVKENELIKLADFLARKFKVGDKELSLALIGSSAIRQLNSSYRGKDYPTDILSFEGEDGFLGELLICPSQIKKQQPFYSADFSKELAFIFVHGFLHLCGYNDENEADRLRMIKAGKKLLDEFYK